MGSFLGLRIRNGHEALAYISGRMRRSHICILEGGRVTVALSPCDLRRGRTTCRFR